MVKKFFVVLLFMVLCIFAVSASETETEAGNGFHYIPEDPPGLRYRFASKDEGKKLLLSDQDYYDGFNQNDLDFRMQQRNASMDEYLRFAQEQVLDFSDGEKEMIGDIFADMEKTLKDNGYVLPEMDEIVLIKTTMKEENEADGYTHGNQIFIGSDLLAAATSGDVDEEILDYVESTFWHELFHCLTRRHPEFRAKMYDLIHFTISEEDFRLPPGEFEYHISNPDVEHHNAYAAFRIDGQDIDCFIDFMTTKHFEKEGDSFFIDSTPVLIPIDGSDTYYMPEQADNYWDMFGENTEYVIDPEECLADNFSLAMQYGMEGPDGEGYPNPEIIEGILSYVRAA